MDYNPRDLDRIARDISGMLENDISRIGIFYRIFYRPKPFKSYLRKVNSIDDEGEPKYDGRNKWLRDIIGLRITTYFADDLEILYKYFTKKFQLLEETVDRNNETEFKPTRTNLIFRIPSQYLKEFDEVMPDKRVDSSFELQLRTVLSEGWHEVDHDLRYKCKNDWENYADISRTFNGLLASLETNDWSILKLFEHLSYQHYRNNSWSAMVRTKFRIRLIDFEVDPALHEILNAQSEISKELFRIGRDEVIVFILQNYIPIPLTLNNLLFLINHFFIKDIRIQQIIPEVINEQLKSYS